MDAQWIGLPASSSALLTPGSASSSSPGANALFRTPLATDSTRGGESSDQVRVRRGTIALSHQIIDPALNGPAGSQGKSSEPETLWSLIDDIFTAEDATPTPSPDGSTSPDALHRHQPSPPERGNRAAPFALIRGMAHGHSSRLDHRSIAWVDESPAAHGAWKWCRATSTVGGDRRYRRSSMAKRVMKDLHSALVEALARAEWCS